MCEYCQQAKAALWTGRAASEFKNSARTWFGTLTLRPSAQHRLVSAARHRLAAGGTDYDALSVKEQFSERLVELGAELTRYLKRVREESGAPLRYLVVAEQHLSGDPHLHILVHEQNGDLPVRERTLAKQWALGFTKFRLATDSRAAAYVCKYISKSMLARVRASIRYGSSECNEDERNDAARHSETNGRCVSQTPHERARSEGRARAEAKLKQEVPALSNVMENEHAKLHCHPKEFGNEQVSDFPETSRQGTSTARKSDATTDAFRTDCYPVGTRLDELPF